MATSSVPKGDVSHRTKPPILGFYCWWLKSDDHQLRLVGYPIIHRVLYIPGWFLGISSINSMFVFGGLRLLNLKKGSMFFPSSIRQSHILDHVLCVVQHGRNWPIRRLWCCDGFHLRQPYNRLLLLEEIPNNHLTSIRNPVNNGDIYHTVYLLILQDFLQINSMIQLIPASSDLAAAASNTYLS